MSLMAFLWRCTGFTLFLISSAAQPAPQAFIADVKNGEALYGRCVACHALANDRTGPRHCGLIGRKAGSVKEFEYSAAMKHSKIVWTTKTLDKFLTNPLKMMPGTSMGYAGITDPKERRDLIAYLLDANNSEVCRKILR